MNSSCYIAINIKIVRFSIYVNKLSLILISCSVIRRTIIISNSFLSFVPSTFCFSSFIKCEYRTPVFYSGNCNFSFSMEVMPIIPDLCPSPLEFTSDSITICIYCLILKQAAVLSLTFADTIFTEVIVVAVNNLDTGQFHAIFVVAITIPTVLSSNTIDVFLAVCPSTGKGFATTFMCALKNAIYHAKLMSDSR